MYFIAYIAIWLNAIVLVSSYMGSKVFFDMSIFFLISSLKNKDNSVL